MIHAVLEKLQSTYCSLSEETLEAITQKGEILSLEKGHLLVREGQISDKVYYLAKGGVKIYYLKDGKKITDWFAFENDFFCAITSYFKEIPSPHFIELLEDSILIQFRKADIEKLYEQYHDFEKLGRISTTKTMLHLQERVVSLQFETAKQKYKNLLQFYPEIEQRASLGDIASYLGITQETLSRIRSTP